MTEEKFKKLYENAKREVEADNLDNGTPILISYDILDYDSQNSIAEVTVKQKGKIHPIQLIMLKYLIEEATADLFETCENYNEHGERTTSYDPATRDLINWLDNNKQR